MKTMFWRRNINRDHLNHADRRYCQYLDDVFRPVVVRNIDKTLEKIFHAFMRMKCIPVGYYLNDRRMFYNDNVVNQNSNRTDVEDCQILVIAAITAGFGHRFTLENYMPPYADDEESRLKIQNMLLQYNKSRSSFKIVFSDI
uniref:PiggyBac transposable element-derived protein domain-containing protein n=1 Tax=Panagrolaimus superbus TaxID=310955 RepID=A0A914XX76_9BILA